MATSGDISWPLLETLSWPRTRLTLDSQGNPSSVFIFQIASTLTTASNASVSFITSGQPCATNIFWQVGSSATLGSGTSFTGDILALASITLNTNAAANGGLYAHTGAVTLDTNRVVQSTQVCSTAATSTPVNTATGTAAPTGTASLRGTAAPTGTASPTGTAAPVGTAAPTGLATATASASGTAIPIVPSTPTSTTAVPSVRKSSHHTVIRTPKTVVHRGTVSHHAPSGPHRPKAVVPRHPRYTFHHLPNTGRFADPLTTGAGPLPPVEARLSITRLGIRWAPIWARGYQRRSVGFENYMIVPAYGVTRFAPSAALGQPGITLMSGHDDIKGCIFRHLGKMRRGDVIQVWRGSHTFRYVVSLLQVVTPDNVAMLNVTRTRPTLALVSCTPYWVDSHRVVVIAVMQ